MVSMDDDRIQADNDDNDDGSIIKKNQKYRRVRSSYGKKTVESEKEKEISWDIPSQEEEDTIFNSTSDTTTATNIAWQSQDDDDDNDDDLRETNSVESTTNELDTESLHEQDNEVEEEVQDEGMNVVDDEKSDETKDHEKEKNDETSIQQQDNEEEEERRSEEERKEWMESVVLKSVKEIVDEAEQSSMTTGDVISQLQELHSTKLSKQERKLVKKHILFLLLQPSTTAPEKKKTKKKKKGAAERIHEAMVNKRIKQQQEQEQERLIQEQNERRAQLIAQKFETSSLELQLERMTDRMELFTKLQHIRQQLLATTTTSTTLSDETPTLTRTNQGHDENNSNDDDDDDDMLILEQSSSEDDDSDEEESAMITMSVTDKLVSRWNQPSSTKKNISSPKSVVANNRASLKHYLKQQQSRAGNQWLARYVRILQHIHYFFMKYSLLFMNIICTIICLFIEIYYGM